MSIKVYRSRDDIQNDIRNARQRLLRPVEIEHQKQRALMLTNGQGSRRDKC